MKIRIEIDEGEEEEIIIKCKTFSNEIKNIQQMLLENINKSKSIEFF